MNVFLRICACVIFTQICSHFHVCVEACSYSNNFNGQICVNLCALKRECSTHLRARGVKLLTKNADFSNFFVTEEYTMLVYTPVCIGTLQMNELYFSAVKK